MLVMYLDGVNVSLKLIKYCMVERCKLNLVSMDQMENEQVVVVV